MSELMVLGFENELEADRFGVALAQMQKDMIVQLQDAAEVVRDPDGKPHVKHGHELVGAGAMGGAFWGMLFGLLFFVPFLGLAIGAGMGALFGKLGKTGMNKEVLEQMGDAVPPGKAGWFLLIGQMTEDKFLAAVKGTNATLVRSNLTEEQEKDLKQPSARASTRSKISCKIRTTRGAAMRAAPRFFGAAATSGAAVLPGRLKRAHPSGSSEAGRRLRSR
jgi:uncharacterized membrane protein